MWVFKVGMFTSQKDPLWVTDNAMYISNYNAKKCDLEFLYILMEHINFMRFQDAGDLKKITQKPFMNMEYIVPALPQQCEYVAFAEKANILKSEIQRNIGKLNMLERALVQQFFE